MDRSIGVVIPAYEPDLDVLSAYVQVIADALSPERIRIELDGSSETAISELETLPATISTSEQRRGKGAAITHGFEALDTAVLAFVDADGSTPVDSLGKVLAPVESESAALSVGSRRHPDARVLSHQTYGRRWLGNAFAFLARAFLSVPLYDFQCGAKAIDAEAWAAVRDHIYEPGFAWDLELIAVAEALGYRIEEVPIEWEDRPGSTVAPIRTSIALATALFVVRHRAKRLGDDRLHSAIETYRDERPTLVEQSEPNQD